MPAKICIIGRTFGRLKVIGESPSCIHPNGKKSRKSKCLCECGKIFDAFNTALLMGNTRSCGCLRKQLARQQFLKHGHCPGSGFSPTYHSWSTMIQRCTNPKRTSFKDYGGRGITVFKPWLIFENFLNDVGERPDGKEIGRINNNGNYEPGNVRWETPMEQGANTRRNRVFTVRGITAHASGLARVFGVAAGTALQRINKQGMNPEDAFTKPPHMRALRR